MGRLSDDLINQPRTYNLRVDTILQSLDDDDRATLLRWLNDPAKYTAHAVAVSLGKIGIKVDKGAVTNWRAENVVS